MVFLPEGADAPAFVGKLRRLVDDSAPFHLLTGVIRSSYNAGLDSRKGDNAWLTVSLHEGRNREIRRVMAHLGLAVTRLIRIAYGPFQLGTLPRDAVDEVPARVLRDQLPREV